jgi:hypothetical protein
VLPLALWLSYGAVLRWRSSELPGRRNYLLAMSLVFVAVLLVGLYFVGYRRELGVAAQLPNVSLKTV